MKEIPGGGRNKLNDIIKKLARRIRWLEETADPPSPFVNLAPTDKADEAGVYSRALLFATDDPKVSNIALTGPYGSGKSSIIQSFLSKYKRPVLQISLAAFLPEATTDGGKVSKQEIERSILQQMLYGADANKLPHSRFKRIQSAGRWSLLKSLYITLAIFACWYLMQHRSAVVSGAFFRPIALANWFNFVCFALGGSFIWLTLHRIYVASFGISLKSISLKDIEITPAAVSQESILNRHLDEIIYFFQSTKYDLVVIEDLDRFNNSDIFVTLREINSLVNENAGVRRTIRFLYALRDDMFINTDRTKFFEFIVPVIPIVNSSNSIDKMLEQGRRLALDDRLDRQFLREVSRYLNDLRLIQNIFNEYAIYVANLETDGENILDTNKLLAVLIYKNVFPQDFEELHRGKGKLAHILDRHDQFIAKAESDYRVQIAEIEGAIDIAERQVPLDQLELRRIYAMAIIEKLPSVTGYVGLNQNAMFELSGLANHSSFDQIIETQQIIYRHPNGYPQSLTLGAFQTEVHPTKTYKTRKEEIERKSAESREAASRKIRELRSKAASLRIKKFNEIIRMSPGDIDSLFADFGENKTLARFLVLEGYLDDTYYQYTSLFHSGRLSPNDNKFLIQIRGFINPEPGFPIDNPKEVIAAMREGDFRQKYVLNVKLVDGLLADPGTYKSQTERLFGFISENFDDCGQFLAAYYAAGAKAGSLIAGLVEEWSEFVHVAMADRKSLSHLGQIIAQLPEQTLIRLPAKYPGLPQFVSENLPDILALGVDFDPLRLKILKVKASDLSAVAAHEGVARILFNEGLFEISIGNLDFIFETILGLGDRVSLHKRHYTSIRNSGNEPLVEIIDRNFGTYLETVLLALEGNSEEDIPSILSILQRDELEVEHLRIFLKMQSAQIPALDQVPARLHTSLFEYSRITASWENCLAFLSSESHDAEILTAYLDQDDTVAALSQTTIREDAEAKPLRNFLFENAALRDEAYRRYVRVLPKSFSSFPADLGPGKLRILIEEARVTFSPESLAQLASEQELSLLFVIRNLDRYLTRQADYKQDDDFRERLLLAQISDDQRLAIMGAMDLTMLADLPSRAAVVGPIFARSGGDMSGLGTPSAIAVIQHSRPIETQIRLFNALHHKFDDDEVRQVLRSLPEPFSDIRPGWGTPKLKSNEVHLALVGWMKSRGFISSWKQGGLFDDDIRINLFRK